MQRPAVVLDCDPGLDDAVAILAAARYSELVGITTVCGNVSIDKTTHNALAVAEVAGVDVPVHRGAARPLVAPLHDARHIHGESGLGGDVAPPTRGTIASDDAVGWLLDVTRARDDIHLVAVGPLTNIALAVRRDPVFVERLASLTIMGGGAHLGNVTATAEFNIWCDPEAAAIVFDAGVTIRMVPLDLTRQVLITAAHVEKLRSAGTATSTFVARLLDFYASRQRLQGKDTAGAVHDPCALLSVTHPHLFQLRDRRVDIELTGTHTRGMTVVDERDRAPERPYNTQVGYSADPDDVLALIIDAAIDPS